VAWWQGELEVTGEFYRESLALWRVVGDKAGIANAAYNLGLCGYITRDWAPSRLLFDEALALFTELGDDRGIGNVLWGKGQADFFASGPATAEGDVGFAIDAAHAASILDLFRSAHEHFRRAGERTMEAWSLHMMALVKAGTGRAREALPDLREALDSFLASGDLVGAALILDDFAFTGAKLGEYETSIVLLASVHEFEDSSGASLFQASQALYPAAWAIADDLPVDPQRTEELRAHGRALSFDDAVALARTIGRPGTDPTVAPAGDPALPTAPQETDP
jgi:tetratricopeptide (TPR) repeat protein